MPAGRQLHQELNRRICSTILRSILASDYDILKTTMVHSLATKLWLVVPASLLLLIILHTSGRISFVQPASATRRVGANCSTGIKTIEFDWDNLLTGDKLAWVPCNGRFECAKLAVPLNYSDPNGRQASIAMLRLPALVSRDSPEYQGPILFNPGGPGGSGVGLVEILGDVFQLIAGPMFDLVGFDPRGVARSTPNAVFFNSTVERVQWALQVPVPYSDDNRLAKYLAYAQTTTSLAAEQAVERDDLAHINTENTARDMLSIVEAHGQDKLQYWGMSYGSVLGSTFATLFPGRVGRLIIDGVVDMKDYFAGRWESNLRDANITWNYFASGCLKAGPSRCALYSLTEAEIVNRVDSILQQVKSRPIPVRTETQYGIVDYDFVRAIMFASLYSPYGTYHLLARALLDLENGNGKTIFELGRGTQSPLFECPSCSNPAAGPPQRVFDELTTIICNDAQVPSPNTLEYAEEHLSKLLKLSEFGNIWADIGLLCSGWPKLPKLFGGPVGGNTSFPLLVLGNTADPVTPLWAAQNTARSFPNSVLLTQNSPGHAVLASFSACTFGHIGEYFQKGSLPASGTVCEVDIELFPPLPGLDDDKENGVQTVFGSAAEERSRVKVAKDILYEKWRKLDHRKALPLSWL